MTAPKHLILGQVLRPHGIKGELRVQLTTNFPEQFKNRQRLVIGTDLENLKTLHVYEVERIRLHQGYGIVKLTTINDRDEADRFRGQYILTPLDEAVPLESDEYYYFQLIGLTMLTDTGEDIGKVAEILETGANIVYVVQGEKYGEVLIPATEEIVQKIDISAGHILITPLPGLLPDS